MALTKVTGLGLGTLDDNITFSTAGKGVHLGVTSATSSNLLDDYEEGTFTPTLTSSAGSNPTIGGSAAGYYTKIGNIVNISMYINNITGGDDNSGVLRIGGLPMAPTTADTVGTVLTDNFTYNGSVNYCIALCDASENDVIIKQIRDTTTDLSIDNANIDDGTADLRISMQYITTQ